MRALILIISLLVSSSVLAADAPGTPEKNTADSKKEPDVNNPAFHEKLKAIAVEYRSWGRVDDSLRIAPLLCAMPPPGSLKPAVARFSASNDLATHGQKLYYLFAANASAYGGLSKHTDDANQAGQIVVKESWSALEVAGTDVGKGMDAPAVATEGHKPVSDLIHDPWIPYAKKDGKVFHAENKLGLYIMYKLDPKTDDTDQGWVYGTVTADGKTVTSAGRVQSCMNCHQEAPHGRLFGLKSAEE